MYSAWSAFNSVNSAPSLSKWSLATFSSNSLGNTYTLPVSYLAAVLLAPQVQLSEGLVGETGRHHERGVASGTAQVQQTALSQHDDAVAIGELKAIHLRLDLLALDAREFGELEHLDFVVEVANVTKDGVVLHLFHVFHTDDVLVTGSGDNDVNLGDDALELHHLGEEQIIMP